MTTPNEFLQFAKERGLGTINSFTSSSSTSVLNNGYTTTGLSVLNNLCRLIEQIHQLKTENDHLRARLELFDQVQSFQRKHHHSVSKHYNEKQKEKTQHITSEKLIDDSDNKSDILISSNSLKIQQFDLISEQTVLESTNLNTKPNLSLSTLHIDHDQSEFTDSNIGSSPPSTPNNWRKVQHAFKFTLRRKPVTSASPPLAYAEKEIPTISISVESDDDNLQENKALKRKPKKLMTTNDNFRHIMTADDTDLDDELTRSIREYQKRKLFRNECSHSSNHERHETLSAHVSFNASHTDDDSSSPRKQSKIASYRRKLRSKLDNVKRQFSDQSSLSMRRFHNSQGTTFENIGSGLNHALITAQLAPALTKSYQQKMREWEAMQKSHFLVTYRRQSIVPKVDLNSNSRKVSIQPTIEEVSSDLTEEPIITIENDTSIIDKLNLETPATILGPILSSNQRSLIVHQWHEIMSEEILLRHYNDYFQKHILSLKQLESSLKVLKTKIFCTNHPMKSQSMTNVQENDQDKRKCCMQRCHSLQSLVSMPASWVLAVQSAAYSDVLDGTSKKANERAFIFNKEFFDQLEMFKQNRQQFEEDSIKNLQFTHKATQNGKTASKEALSNESRAKLISTRNCFRKLSLISFSEYPQHFLSDSILPLRTISSQIKSLDSNIEILPATTNNDIDLNKNLSISFDNVNKQPKRLRFDLIKTFQRSKSMCMSQLNSWLQRRRLNQTNVRAAKSTTQPKVSTFGAKSKLLGSPRLARLHQRLFKQRASSSSQVDHHKSTPIQILDDSDNQSQKEIPVRIYFPPYTAPIPRHVRIADNDTLISNNDQSTIQIDSASSLTSPIIIRKNLLPSLKPITAKERRESFATLSNNFNNRCL